MDKIRVLNIDVLNITESQLQEGLDRNLKGCGGNGVLITPNLDHLVKLQKDNEFYQCYLQAEWVVCDSRVLWLSSRLLKKSFLESIPGSTFFTHFYEYHRSNQDCRIFLLGGLGNVAELAQQRINRKVGRRMVVGAYSPSLGFETNQMECQKICQMISESQASVVLVGVGAPKQEKWIFTYRSSLPSVKIWMALGATIDFEAGTKKRAPRIFQKLALEWFYRLCSEPNRMFKRYLCDDPTFFWFFVKQLVGKYRNPLANIK